MSVARVSVYGLPLDDDTFVQNVVLVLRWATSKSFCMPVGTMATLVETNSRHLSGHAATSISTAFLLIRSGESVT